MRVRKKLLCLLFAAFICCVVSTRLYAQTSGENYLYYCAQCHGIMGDGKGPNALETLPVDPRDFTDPTALGKLTDDEVVNIITNGGQAPSHSTVMPPYKMTLTTEEIVELKDFLRSFYNVKTR